MFQINLLFNPTSPMDLNLACCGRLSDPLFLAPFFTLFLYCWRAVVAAVWPSWAVPPGL